MNILTIWFRTYRTTWSTNTMSFFLVPWTFTWSWKYHFAFQKDVDNFEKEDKACKFLVKGAVAISYGYKWKGNIKSFLKVIPGNWKIVCFYNVFERQVHMSLSCWFQFQNCVKTQSGMLIPLFHSQEGGQLLRIAWCEEPKHEQKIRIF